MTDDRLNSPWLPDWRSFADEAENLSPRSRRTLQEAIRRKSEEWEDKHEESYRERFRKNRDTRKAKVFDACDELTKQLKQIRTELDWGRITPAQAKAKLRDINGRHQQIMELHDTLVEEDAEIEAFADLTPDEFQRQFVDKFPVLIKTQPSLSAFTDQINPPPPPGGHRVADPNFVPTYDAPSAEDLTY